MLLSCPQTTVAKTSLAYSLLCASDAHIASALFICASDAHIASALFICASDAHIASAQVTS